MSATKFALGIRSCMAIVSAEVISSSMRVVSRVWRCQGSGREARSTKLPARDRTGGEPRAATLDSARILEEMTSALTIATQLRTPKANFVTLINAC